MNKKEALEIVRKNYPHVGVSGSEFETALRELVPELNESEDERIRKAIKEAVDVYWSDDKQARLDIYSYLEKQREQKLTNDILESSFRIQECLFESSKPLKIKQNKPAEWSEEDEVKLNAVISLMKSNRAVDPFYDKMCLEGWLKSLRPQPHWRPSEVQMCALKYASTYVPDDEGTLAELYEQLKKL